MTKKLEAVHPGEVLNEDFLKPLGITQYKLAQAIDVPARRINEIVLGKRSLTADTAVRLARFFGTSEMFWMNLQSRYELDRTAVPTSSLRSRPTQLPAQRRAFSTHTARATSARRAK